MNKQTAEYIIIHKTDHGCFQDTIDNLSAQGFTMVGPARLPVGKNEDLHYLATMERKVEAREEVEQ